MRHIGLRIASSYFAIVVAVVLLSSLLYHGASTRYAEQQVGEAARQTLAAVQMNVNLMLSNANNYSKMIFSDNNLQTLLRTGSVYSNLTMQSRVSAYLYNLMQSVPIIDSVYIFDFSNNVYSVSTKPIAKFLPDRVYDAPWYDDVMGMSGAYILSVNGEGAFTQSNSGNYVSLIRLVRDVEDTANLGILAINIPEKAFSQVYDSVMDANALSVAVLDEAGRPIVRLGSSDEDRDALLRAHALDSASQLVVRDEYRQYMVLRLPDEHSGWTYVGIMPLSGIIGNNQVLMMALLLFAATGLILFVSSLIISRSFTKPIAKLLATMESAQRGGYGLVDGRASTLEFEQLYTGYNRMISELQTLHSQKVDEEKTLRKAELDALQSQIKPHFLYNTLDSIVALALMGDNPQVARLAESLSGYYRLSVSKGRDVISVREEIEIVRNYLAIQQIRYPNLYTVIYDVNPDCLDQQMPKLVLQPLVENALYHGLRAKIGRGEIRLGAQCLNGWVTLTVEDDGIGMSEQQIRQILNGERTGEMLSFGLWGTMERLRIFYGADDCFLIHSAPGQGTKITIQFPEVRQ